MLTHRLRKRRWGNELERARRARLADFEMRSEPGPGALPVASIEGTPTRYIAVHFFADEAIPASEFGPPEVHGHTVDAYVCDGRDVYFAQMSTTRVIGRTPSLLTSWWHDDPPRLHLWQVVAVEAITRSLFESWLVAVVGHAAVREPIGPPRSWKPILPVAPH